MDNEMIVAKALLYLSILLALVVAWPYYADLIRGVYYLIRIELLIHTQGTL